MPKNSCIMQIWAEPAKSALPICNYSQILYRFLTFTQNLKRSPLERLQTILRIHPCLHLAIQSKSCIFQRIINRQSVQAPLGIRRGPYPGFCLIAVNPEDVAVIVVNVDAVMHRVIFSVYQFHCYQSFYLNWR